MEITQTIQGNGNTTNGNNTNSSGNGNTTNGNNTNSSGGNQNTTNTVSGSKDSNLTSKILPKTGYQKILLVVIVIVLGIAIICYKKSKLY